MPRKSTKIIIFFIFSILFFAQTPCEDKMKIENNEFENLEISSQNTKDVNRKFCIYYLKILESKIISINDIENYIDQINNGPLTNPLECNERNQSVCKNSAYSLHREGFAKIIKQNQKDLNKEKIITFLKNVVEEQKNVITSKTLHKEQNQDLHIVDFAFVPPGDYRIFYKLERVGPLPKDAQKHSFSSPAPLLPLESLKDFVEQLLFGEQALPETYYRFPKLKLDKGFELATTLVSEKLFAEVMLENPTYEAYLRLHSHSDLARILQLEMFEKEGKKVFYENFKSARFITPEKAKEFIDKLNLAVERGEPSILKMLRTNKKCKYSLPNKEQYNYLKYLYFKNNYFFEPGSDTKIILKLEDALFLKNEAVFVKNPHDFDNKINKSLNRNGYQDGTEKLTNLNFELVYYDKIGKLTKLSNANLKISAFMEHPPQFYHPNDKRFNGGIRLWENKTFEIDNKDIYDLFDRQNIFFTSGESVLFDT